MIKASAELIERVKQSATQLRAMLSEHAGTVAHEELARVITNELTRKINIAAGYAVSDGPIDWVRWEYPIAEALAWYRHRVFIENYA